MRDRDEVMALRQRLKDAHKTKDVDVIVSCYAPDAVIYSLAPPLASRTANPSDLKEWLATWDGPITIKMQDDNLDLHETIAWSNELTCLCGKKTDGTNVEMWFRTTQCFRRVEGHWLIAHEHSSTPFYMDGSFRAAIDLTPDSRTAWNAT